MPLNLIHGPPNSGRTGHVLTRFRRLLDAAPILVVPNLDDAFRLETELARDGGAVGGTVTTFNGLFGIVAAAGGEPSPPTLTAAQRLRLVGVGVESSRSTLGPLRRSARRGGFAASLDRLLAELQAAGLEPTDVEAGAGTLEGSAYLSDLATLFTAYERAREEAGRIDSHGVARAALELLGGPDGTALWGGRPVLVHGVDDFTVHQLRLVRLLAGIAEVTVSATHEEGRDVLEARSKLIGRLRAVAGDTGVGEEIVTEPEPSNTDAPLLFELERALGVSGAAVEAEAGAGLQFLRSAGERGEAESIGTVVARRLADGADPAEIAIVVRDPARRGPLIGRVLESYGVGVALEAELPVASSGVGGALLALLEAEHGTRRAADLLRWMRGPLGLRPGRVDWFERRIRRDRAQTADQALALWSEADEDLPYDLRSLREAGEAGLAKAVGEAATRMALRFLDGDEDGPPPGPGDGTELQAAAAISVALAEVCELEGPAPSPSELIALLRDLGFRAWIGPIEGRVRIADPQRLRAGRFDHVVIASLQDGEFPRRGGGDPFLSEPQRDSLGLDPRRDDDAEERYLFYSSLSLARRSLTLSYRDSDDAGAALARSPLLDDVRQALAPPPAEGPDEVEIGLTRDRGLADTVLSPSEAPSEGELARSLATLRAEEGIAGALVTAAPDAEIAARLGTRLASARAVERASRAPGPIANPAVLEGLRGVPAYGGTTLEGFDLCSYRWFADHELDPKPLDPLPDAIAQGGLMHSVLERLYGERPGGAPLPSPETLDAWRERGLELVAELAAERLGDAAAERAIRRGVERLLCRFLADESGRDPRVFEPQLLEAGFGEGEDAERPPLEIDGWRLHGAIDRIDLAPDGRALVHDYKVSAKASPAAKLEEDAKLQLQLYLIAARELWGTTPVGAVYHPLRATSVRRPRGLVLKGEEGLPDLGLAGPDLLEADAFEGMLEDARRRSGEIVARMRSGEIRRDPGPRAGLTGHDVCPAWCDFAPICRRDRAPVDEDEREFEER